jgi:hypothetical protein
MSIVSGWSGGAPHALPPGGDTIPPEHQRPSPFARLGQLSPLSLGGAYGAATCVAMVLHYAANRAAAPVLRELGLVLAGGALLALYIVVTWYRDDEPFAAGVLLALTAGAGGSVGTAIAAGLVRHSLVASVAVLRFSPMRLVVAGFVLIPVSAVLVWVARLLSLTVERVLDVQPARAVAAPPAAHQSVWDPRQAHRNGTPAPPSAG